MQLIGRRPQEMAFSPAEFAQYAELIDRYIANPTRAIDLRDDIKRIGVSRLLRGVQEMQAAHYEQLAALYEEQRRTWVKIRAQRPPIRLSARDMAGLAVMFAAAPALGALVLLPYVIDRLLRHNRRGRAREISEEIAKMKQEIIRDNQRTDILRELRDGNKKRVEEIKKMEQDERKAICEAVSLKIDSSAQKSKKFGGYVGYINDIGAGKANLTYANMAAMYHRDFWVGNNAVICGTDKMLDAAIVASTERPENGALYVLPIVFDVISKKKVYDTLDAPTLKLEVQSFLADKQAQKNYIDEELAVITAENKSKIYDENKLSEEIDKRLSTMGQALQAPQRRPANIWGNVSVPDAEYQELIKRAQASAMQEAEIKRLDAANNRLFEEKKAETAKNEDLEQKITDIRTSLAVSNAIKDEYAQDNVELSEQNKMLLSYISAQGLNSSLAQWIEERTKTEQAIEKQVAQQQYDGMEM